jgi:nitrate reductase gamma subunit
MFWLVFVFGIIAIFIIIIIYRMVAIAKLPVHLRWELAPIPHEIGKNAYGGSYLEEYEWWQKPGKRSVIAPLLYIAIEILLLRGIWKNNRALWPLTLGFHFGIYLIVLMLVVVIVNSVLIITEILPDIIHIIGEIASILALIGFAFGSLGVIGMIIKRSIDSNLRPFNSFIRYFNLVFLGIVSVSGLAAWVYNGNYGYKISYFIESLITMDTAVMVAFPLSLHIILSMLFILYLPMSDMIHFVAKYFMYHEIRWNDKPLDVKMEKEVQKMLLQPINWSAGHINSSGGKKWSVIVKEK